MNTQPERNVSVVGPIDNDMVGIGKLSGVPIGRWKRQQNPFPRRNRTAPNFGIRRNEAAHGDGRIGTKELFHCSWNQCRLGHEAPSIIFVPCQVPQR